MPELLAVVESLSASDEAMPQLPVYLDNMATTPVDPRVVEAMLPFFTKDFGNPASKLHEYGCRAADAVEDARDAVATLIGATSREIVFSSGTTESNNLALKGTAEQLRSRGNKIISCSTEHVSVLNPLHQLSENGFEVVLLPVDSAGVLDIDRLASEIDEQTILISVMAGNNETGTVHDLEALGDLAKSKGVLWHCDAAQAVGKIPFSVNIGADLVSLSAHKLYGPKGVGALYVRSRNPRVRLVTQLSGGAHERGLRGGTLNVPGSVGFGAAARLLQTEGSQVAEKVLELRSRFLARLTDDLESIRLNGHPTSFVPGCINLEIAGVDSAGLIASMKAIAVASAAACSSGGTEPSHVLKAMGRSNTQAAASIRIGIGRFNSEAEIDFATDCIVRQVRTLRRDSLRSTGFGRETVGMVG